MILTHMLGSHGVAGHSMLQRYYINNVLGRIGNPLFQTRYSMKPIKLSPTCYLYVVTCPVIVSKVCVCKSTCYRCDLSTVTKQHSVCLSIHLYACVCVCVFVCAFVYGHHGSINLKLEHIV